MVMGNASLAHIQAACQGEGGVPLFPVEKRQWPSTVRMLE